MCPYGPFQGALSFPVTYQDNNQAIPIESVRATVEQSLGCAYYINWECLHATSASYSWWVDYSSLNVEWVQTQGTMCTADGESSIPI